MALEVISSAGSTATTGAKTYTTSEVKGASIPVVDNKVESVDQTEQNVIPTYAYDKQAAEENLKSSAPSDSVIKQAISDINKRINPNTIAEYGFHEETKRVTIKIVDKDSEKVIREYPAEETLDMIAKVWELAGMFLDEKR